jgi:AraC family transcriptional regulator
MEITIVDVPDQQAVAVLHLGPYTQIGPAFERLGTWAKTNIGSVTGPPLALFLDDPEVTPPDQLRSYAALPVAQDLALDETAEVERIPVAGGRCAVAVHVGSYAGLGQAWQEFMAAVAADGLHPDGSRPSFEVYANDPGLVPPEQLRTELHQPIA